MKKLRNRIYTWAERRLGFYAAQEIHRRGLETGVWIGKQFREQEIVQLLIERDVISRHDRALIAEIKQHQGGTK